jgi:hypothetical protein
MQRWRGDPESYGGWPWDLPVKDNQLKSKILSEECRS